MRVGEGEFVCKKCLVHDYFFVGGGSWAPDACPKCGGTECVLYEELSPLKKAKVQRLFRKHWNKKFGRAKL